MKKSIAKRILKHKSLNKRNPMSNEVAKASP